MSNTISTVHLIFKTHLDVGFTDFEDRVIRQYFDHFIPAALDTADRLREAGDSERFVWTTGSWLVYEFLERASPSDRRRMETAISAGDIKWHAIPFTVHSELMDPALFRFGLSLSRELDGRFGKETIAAKLTDVPGHTRGIVPLLREAGVELLHIGVNEASTPPDVPPLFVWRTPNGSELLVMYDRGYGGTKTIPGHGEAVSFAHTMDNRGPQGPEEVQAAFRELRSLFPGATVTASTLDDVAAALRPLWSTLPVVTAEIGDTWIHGVGSDPRKVAHFRALSRLHAEWTGQRATESRHREEPELHSFGRNLLLVAEHTWGLDDKTHLADYTHYSREQFDARYQNRAFRKIESSWQEQREYIDRAISDLRSREWSDRACAAAKEVEPEQPDPEQLERQGFVRYEPNSLELGTAYFALRFDPVTGAIESLLDKRSEHRVADSDHPLGTFRYQSFSHLDYDRFLSQYITRDLSWAAYDFGKPGLERVACESAMWLPQAIAFWHWSEGGEHQVAVELGMPKDAVDDYGSPGKIWLIVTIPSNDPSLHFDLRWFEKSASRLPEASWFSFVPSIGPESQWKLKKLGEYIDSRDVVSNGGRHLHAVEDKVMCLNDKGSLIVQTLDCPLVATGRLSLLDFKNELPAPEEGVHFNLHNNVWGTNFPSWFGEDARFRFSFSLSDR